MVERLRGMYCSKSYLSSAQVIGNLVNMLVGEQERWEYRYLLPGGEK